ncbi:MAG: formate dehydrogenase subunit alpha, partial [Tissierellia bacterium]|nr:formate dehydrogenase subunit alpha [Tissierellia bacterium]
IMDEIASLTPSYAGVTYERLEKVGLQWPVPNKEHPGTKYLHKAAIARGRGLFMPTEYVESAEMPSAEYPYILTTGRILYHYHTMTMTGREDGLNQLAPESFVEINETTANKLDIVDGEMIRLTSRRGELEVKARVLDTIDEGVVFMPFHYTEGKANLLTNSVVDDIAKIPELKVAAVKIEKL